ncbi:MAG: lambda exonuclease family protein [Vulcanimicrobiaceae bacterium]
MQLAPLEIIDCIQGSPEWYEARRGCVTASKFATVMASGRDGGASKTRKTYMYTLAGQILSGEVAEGYKNDHMDRGNEMEAEARDYYSFLNEVTPRQVGFLKRGQIGCSPDGVIDDNGLLEIKTKLPHLHLPVVEAGVVPPEHKAQCQGALWISEREWIDFQSYWPKLPPFIKRLYRDEVYIAELSKAVEIFLDELNEMVERLRKI